MIVVNRFQVPAEKSLEFEAQANAAVEVLGAKPGNSSIELVRNVDEQELWAIVSHWQDVGSYRRALGGWDSKMTVVPLLSMAIDEPSAYTLPADVGENIPRSL